MQYLPRQTCLQCGGRKERSRSHRCDACSAAACKRREWLRLSNPFWQTARGKGIKAYQEGKRYCQRCDVVMEPEEFGREGGGAYCLSHWLEYRCEIERAHEARKRLKRPPGPDPVERSEKVFVQEFGRVLVHALRRQLKRASVARVRKCKVCHQVQPVSAFGVADRRCNTCNRRRAPRPAAARQRTVARESAKTAWLVSVKMASGCVDCGYRERPEALHFDHVDPMTKSFTISSRRGLGWAMLRAEVEKCVVRCANCHAVRSRRDGHSGLRVAESAS